VTEVRVQPAKQLAVVRQQGDRGGAQQHREHGASQASHQPGGNALAYSRLAFGTPTAMGGPRRRG
jgi:hypothetical protein